MNRSVRGTALILAAAIACTSIGGKTLAQCVDTTTGPTGIVTHDDFVPWPNAIGGGAQEVRVYPLANDVLYDDGTLSLSGPLAASFPVASLRIDTDQRAIVVQPSVVTYPAQPAITYTARSTGGATATGHIYFTAPVATTPTRSVSIHYTCKGPSCIFTAVPMLGPTPTSPAEIRSYRWSFDGYPNCNRDDWRGQTLPCDFAATPANSIAHLTASFYSGEVLQASDANVSWSPPPTPALQWACTDPNKPVSSLLVSCSVTRVGDLNSFRDQMSVDWGDGWSDGLSWVTSGPNPAHVYHYPGLYHAILTASFYGYSTPFPLDIEVANQPPTVSSFTAGGTDPDSVNFAATVQDEHKQDPAWHVQADWFPKNYDWDFGDGTFATLPAAATIFDRPQAQHNYKHTGTYTATLRVADDFGAVGSSTKTVTVTATRPHPKFATSCTGKTCSFDAGASQSDAPIPYYYWYLDGSQLPQTTQVLSYTFPAEGQHMVALEVSNGFTFSAARERVTTYVTVQDSTVSAPLHFYELITPCRLYDSRSAQRAASGITLQIPLSTACGIPTDASGLAATVTVLNPSGRGYLKALAPGDVGSLNNFLSFSNANAPRSSGVFLPARNGAVAIQPIVSGNGANTDLVVDVLGYFSASSEVGPIVSGKGSPGPFVYYPLKPCRLVDSAFSPPDLTAGTPVAIKARGNCGLPAAAPTLLANIAFIPNAGGYLLAYDASSARPPIVTMTFPSAGVVSVGTIVAMNYRVGPAADVGLYSVGSGGRYIIDVNGYLDSPSPAQAPLEYYSIRPCRILDTRSSVSGMDPLLSEVQRNFTISGNCSVPSEARAVAASFSVVTPPAAGYLKLFAADQSRPIASSMNFAQGDVLSNFGIIPLATGPDQLAIAPTLFSSNGSSQSVDVVLDVYGYFAAPHITATVTDKGGL